MMLSMIAALDENGLIGRDNALPWRLPADLKRFREITWGRPIIMGRKTFESIGRPLPGRTNIVVTRNRQWRAEGVLVAPSPREALARAGDAAEVIVVGGASLYAHFLPRADRLYLTRVHAAFEGDAYFPAIDIAEWREAERIDCRADEKNPHDYSFVRLERKRPAGTSFEVGDLVEIRLPGHAGQPEAWHPGTIVAIEPYSQHRSFHWVRLDRPAATRGGQETEVISVLNPKNIRRPHPSRPR